MKSAVRYRRALSALIIAGFTTTTVAVGPTHTVTITPSPTTFGATAGQISLTVTMAYSEASLSGLGIQLVAPTGWQFVSTAGGANLPNTSPGTGQIGNLPFAYFSVPASPVSFTFTVSYPAGLTGNQVFSTVRTNFTDEATGSPIIESWPSITVSPASTAPTITTQPQSQIVVAGASVSFTVVAGGNPAPTIQWRKAGTNIAGATNTTYTINPVTAGDAGSYDIVASNGTLPNATSNAATLTVSPASSTPTVVGSATVVKLDIVHPNGNVYDQVLLTGSSATIAAAANKVTRTSFIDLTDDIVQVEFSGAGTLSLVLDNPSGPAAPVNYTQPTVLYMKGHASIILAGANESSNVTVFSVGRATAYDPMGGYNIALPISATNNPANNGSPLFQGHASTAYDGVADIGSVSISSTNGKFGGVRTANASYFAISGNTGIYASGVQFTGPVYVGDINASGSATPVLLLGSASDTRINGGDLLQSNVQPVRVSGITHLQFVDGVTSQNVALPAQTNKAVLQQDGVDVTAQIVNPTN